MVHRIPALRKGHSSRWNKPALSIAMSTPWPQPSTTASAADMGEGTTLYMAASSSEGTDASTTAVKAPSKALEMASRMTRKMLRACKMAAMRPTRR